MWTTRKQDSVSIDEDAKRCVEVVVVDLGFEGEGLKEGGHTKPELIL